MRLSKQMLTSLLLAAPISVFANADPFVNPNKAGAQEMHDDLIGVTEQQAAEIVSYRNKHGNFDSEKDLLKVEGIERDFLNINQDYLYLEQKPGTRVSG